MFMAEVGADPSIPAWLGVTIAVLTLIGGGTGVGAIMKAAADRKLGVDSHELEEDNALGERWKQLAAAQVDLLLEPLRIEMAALRIEIAAMKSESDTTRTKYWRAVGHIRALTNWISRHVSDHDRVPPPPPADIAEDI